MLRLEYEDLDIQELHLELHRTNVLLRNIEDARKAIAAADRKVDGDCAAAATTYVKADANDLPGRTAGADGDPDGVDKVAKDGGSNDNDKAGVGAGKAGRDAPAKPYTVGARDEWQGAGEAKPRRGTNGRARSMGGRNSGEQMGAGNGAPSRSAYCSSNNTTTSDGGSGSGSSETDTVGAFWAAAAAAAPLSQPPQPPRSSGIFRDAVVSASYPAAGLEAEGDGGEEAEEEETESDDGKFGGAGDSPLSKGGAVGAARASAASVYESLSTPVRVAILSALCEDCVEQEHFRDRVIVSFGIKGRVLRHVF